MTIPGFIREQPEALDRCLAAAQAFVGRWSPGSLRNIVLVGSGSSFNALTIARPHFVAAGRGAVVVCEPGDFPAELPLLDQRTLVVVLSQSGASTTSIAAARAAVEAGLGVLAITASGEAALARLGAPALIMAVGEEPVGPKTKGFVGSMATLFVVAEALGGPCVPAMRGSDLAPLIEPAREMAEALVPSLAGVDQIIVAGRRANYGVALEASLKIAEMAGIPSSAFPTEELLHGRLHGMTERSVAFVIAEGEAEVAQARLAGAAMERRGCRLVTLDSARMPWPTSRALPASPWNALGLVLPFQWLAVLLGEARGLRPEAMRHGNLSRELDIKTAAQ